MGATRAWVLPVLVVGLLASGGTAAVVARSGGGPELPDGWRWESFQDVELAVPGSWGHTASADMSGGCSVPPGPVVSRPGTIPLVSCSGTGRQVGEFVEFEYGRSAPDVPGTVGDRTTVRAGSVVVIVQAPAELRERILATVRAVETDAYGCAVSDPLAAEPGLRPSPPVDVTRLTGIESVTACMYDIPEPDDPVPGEPPRSCTEPNRA